MDSITLRTSFVDYITTGIRFTKKETGLDWPNESIIIVKSYDSLAQFDEIIGMKVFICDLIGSFDFGIAFPSNHTDKYKLQKAFDEYLSLYTFL